MSQPHADRNLLFGILAVQMDFVTRDQLLAAMNAWVLDKGKPLGDILRAQGALAADDHKLLEQLVAKHLAKHGNDPARSLAAVSPVGEVREAQAHFADNPESRSRFVLEAEITGALEHPGIVPVYGLGTYADGRPFYAMRFIQGDNLRDAIRRFHEAAQDRPRYDSV